MAYSWKGMRKLTWEEVKQMHKEKKLAGCYKLYDDGSEAQIDRGYDFIDDILEHHEQGGEFGDEIETVELQLKDCKKIIAPARIDLSELGCLDELEYELWGVIESYMSTLGIRTEDDTPDWATVKAVQEALLKEFTDASVVFKFGLEEEPTVEEKSTERGNNEV